VLPRELSATPKELGVPAGEAWSSGIKVKEGSIGKPGRPYRPLWKLPTSVLFSFHRKPLKFVNNFPGCSVSQGPTAEEGGETEAGAVITFQASKDFR
jgi:hypothetical protein